MTSISTAEYRHTLTTTGEREVRVERHFEAPLAKVWRAYTEPDILKQWWGRGNPLDIERWEFEKGGHWRFVEHANGDRHGFEGRFREIVQGRSIAMTFEWDGMPGHVTIDTTTFEESADGRTRIVVTSQFFTQEERDGMMSSGMEGGMAQSYAALDRVLQTL
jgi:uncharacterized protein YndB with AHSA1/START domain